MRQKRSEDTVRKVIDAAMGLFVKEGYHGASIADIAAATGLTKGAIYFHFRSKDALMSAILKEFEELYLDRMMAEVAAVKGSALDKIKHYLRFTVNFLPRDLNLCFTHLATELYASGSKPGGIEKIYHKYHDFMVRLLEKGKEEGSFRKDVDPNILALNLMGALEGNLVQWKFNIGNCTGDAFARSFLKFYLRGIQAQSDDGQAS